ncbi:MAG: hypothetical protein V3V70_08710 [Candidatus Scalindua sp.]
MTLVKQEFEKDKTLAEIRESIKPLKYKDWNQYGDWISVNIETAYNEINQEQR